MYHSNVRNELGTIIPQKTMNIPMSYQSQTYLGNFNSRSTLS